MTRGEENPLAVPVTPRAGSAIIWHGNTWHGAFARTAPGLRMNLVYSFCRQFVEPQEGMRGRVPPEAWARHPGDERFASLVGEYSFYGWRSDEEFAAMVASPRGHQAGNGWHA
jgi:ectoine hydroxylase-related dioxygenase (phytanoyl-CoA dioxygenase family)